MSPLLVTSNSSSTMSPHFFAKPILNTWISRRVFPKPKTDLHVYIYLGRWTSGRNCGTRAPTTSNMWTETAPALAPVHSTCACCSRNTCVVCAARCSKPGPPTAAHYKLKRTKNCTTKQIMIIWLHVKYHLKYHGSKTFSLYNINIFTLKEL